MEDLWLLMPEIILLTMASIVLIVDLFLSKKTRVITYVLSQASLVFTAISLNYLPGGVHTAFHDQVVVDNFATITKLIILTLVFFVLIYSRAYVRERELPYGEFHALTLFSTLGMMFLVSAKSMLMIYLGLELLSLPLYAMVALQRDSSLAVEAGIKYFIMGALASGLLLYGISLLYGLSGSIQLDVISTFLNTAQSTRWEVSLLALALIVVGVAFKLGAAPFHMWVPDVYHGAPTNVTLLIGSAPKIAAFGMAYRFLHDTLSSFSGTWSQFFIVIAILSLAIGNIVAISQFNVKRLLAYSTISHVGYLFLGLLVAPMVGYAPAMYYMVVYGFVAACAFGVLLILSQHTDAQTFDDLKGLSQRNPWLAFLMLLVAFSLAGVPPTVGFYAKFTILSALVDAGFTWLAAVAVVFSIIGAFYYIKIVRVMYFEAPPTTVVIKGARDFQMALSLNGIAILMAGIIPAPLFLLCQKALLP